MNMYKIFVYGTLKRGHGNNRLLANSKFLGTAVTHTRYKMLAGGFPVLLEEPDGKTVAGEVYEVDDATLRRLDSLEAEGSMYDRKTVTVILHNSWHGHMMEVFIYIGCDRAWRMTNERSYAQPWKKENEHGQLEWN